MKQPKLPGYEIQELLGESFCGSVWLAEDPLGNPVVIRALRRDLGN